MLEKSLVGWSQHRSHFPYLTHPCPRACGLLTQQDIISTTVGYFWPPDSKNILLIQIVWVCDISSRPAGLCRSMCGPGTSGWVGSSGVITLPGWTLWQQRDQQVRDLGVGLNIEMPSYQYRIPMSRDCLIFNIGIPIPGKDGLILRQGPAAAHFNTNPCIGIPIIRIKWS